MPPVAENLYRSGLPDEAVKVATAGMHGALAFWIRQQQIVAEEATQVREGEAPSRRSGPSEGQQSCRGSVCVYFITFARSIAPRRRSASSGHPYPSVRNPSQRAAARRFGGQLAEPVPSRCANTIHWQPDPVALSGERSKPPVVTCCGRAAHSVGAAVNQAFTVHPCRTSVERELTERSRLPPLPFCSKWSSRS